MSILPPKAAKQGAMTGPEAAIRTSLNVERATDNLEQVMYALTETVSFLETAVSPILGAPHGDSGPRPDRASAESQLAERISCSMDSAQNLIYRIQSIIDRL